MIKPNMPNMPGIPGIGAMTDTLEFVKNLWGGMGLPGMNMTGMSMPGMNLPGMVMPTLSVDEINKRITDLKAVETWLTLNMNMLRGTIQALEVQAATISTLQSMGETFSATMGAGLKEKPAAEPQQPPAAAPVSNGAAEAHDESRESVAPTSRDESDAATLTAPLVNAAAWWNMLQDQFKQAVNSAMTPEAPPASPPAEKKAKPKAKPAAAPAPTATARKRKTAK